MSAHSRCQIRPPIVDEPDHVGQRREVAQLQVVVARNAVGLADRGKHLRLLYGIDAQIGFEIQIEVEHIHRIAGFLGDQREDALFHRIGSRCGVAGGGAGGCGTRRRRRHLRAASRSRHWLRAAPAEPARICTSRRRFTASAAAP